MPFGLSIQTTGLDDLYDLFNHQLPYVVRGVAVEAAADDLVGDGSRGLKHYPSYRYIPRRGQWASERQRRYVMAQIRSGRIQPGYPHRTGNFQRSIHRVGSGESSSIEMTLPHEGWPNRFAQRGGWREPQEIIDTNIRHATIAAERAVQAEINQRGWG